MRRFLVNPATAVAAAMAAFLFLLSGVAYSTHDRSDEVAPASTPAATSLIEGASVDAHPLTDALGTKA